MSTEPPAAKKTAFKIPTCLAGTTDLRRVLRELEVADDVIYQNDLRTHAASSSPPKTTKLLADLFELNDSKLLDQRCRKEMLVTLKRLDEKAPVLHISFAVEADWAFMEKIVVWARQNIHSCALINAGLQPSVIVGCNLRATNKMFDMSLRNRFAASKYILNEKIKKMGEANG